MKENISQNMFVSYSNQAGILYNYLKNTIELCVFRVDKMLVML